MSLKKTLKNNDCNNKTIFSSKSSSEESAYVPLQVAGVFCLSNTVRKDIKCVHKSTSHCEVSVSRVSALARAVTWHFGSPKPTASFLEIDKHIQSIEQLFTILFIKTP